MARLVRMKTALQTQVADEVRELAESIRDHAKRIVPVDTGSLMRSIRVQVYADPALHVKNVGVSAGGYITNPKTRRKVDYAGKVEFGTSRMRPRPFMRQAVEAHRKWLRTLLKKVVEDSR